MITNRCLKYLFTPFLIPILISGITLQGILPRFCNAASHITSDGTMGTVINQVGNVYNIDGGTIKGSNLFDSFGLFNVGTGDTASFNGPSGIVNIIGRVTGGQQSTIDGKLQSTINGANLYLLNPYGVLFGPNATLDVSGSFHVSTADYLRMTDGARFYANLGKQSTLSTAPVAAFGFLSNNPAAISIQGSNLSVPEGETLSIIGGDINITGGWMFALSGRINIASVASPGEVIPLESRNAPDLKMSSFDRLGGINLLNSTVDVESSIGSSSGNGTVLIRGGKLLIENSYVGANNNGNTDGAKVGIDIGIKEDFSADGASIEAGTFGTGRGGDVLIRSGSMEMKNSTIEAYTYGVGNSGNVDVCTGSLDMREGSQIGNDTYSSGNAGNVTVTADSIFMTGAYDPSVRTTGLYSGTESGAGRGGDLSVITSSLEVRDGAGILAYTNGSGAGGNVNINADSMFISGQNAKGLSASIAAWSNSSGNAGGIDINAGNLEVQNGNIGSISGSSGKAGDLEVTADRILLTEGTKLYANGTIADSGNILIKAGSLEVTDGSQIASSSFSSGAAGNIEVTANSILLSGVDTGGHQSAIFCSVGLGATGAGGTIQINTQSLEVKEGATIFGATLGPGNASKIEVNAESILVSGTKYGYQASLVASTGSSGNAGDIEITAKNLEVNDGGYIEASTYGSGRAGNILVKAPWVTVANGGDISAFTSGSGTGGSIQLLGNQIQLINGAYISSQSLGTSNAGDINIKAGNILLMENSKITTSATHADGGNIDIKAGQMVELIDSKITASVGGGPQTTGGNITIDPQYVILNDSKVIANAYEGKGGNIKINADIFLSSPESVVSASSKLGISGTVDIRAPITNLSETLAPIQENFLSAEELLRDRCAAKIRGGKYSSFVVSGRDGLPIRPGSVLPSPIY